jgi:hypothetical protein
MNLSDEASRLEQCKLEWNYCNYESLSQKNNHRKGKNATSAKEASQI